MNVAPGVMDRIKIPESSNNMFRLGADNMPVFGLKRLLPPLLLLVVGSVGAKDLSGYPCTVFSPDACFRLPVGTHVDYSVPADFALYEVSKGVKLVATIYIGNAPQRMEGSVDPSVTELANGTIKIYRNGAVPAERLDIYITPKIKDASTVHISADLSASTRNELIELLSSLRPCKPVKSGGQKCPLNATWSNELTRALMP